MEPRSPTRCSRSARSTRGGYLTNGQPGTWRTILVQGNDGTDRTITFGNQYLGDVPAITDCDSVRWYLLMIFCVSTSHFVISAKRAKG